EYARARIISPKIVFNPALGITNISLMVQPLFSGFSKTRGGKRKAFLQTYEPTYRSLQSQGHSQCRVIKMPK
ncbi:MAG: hypothetical protein QME78_16050, partial [Thermodesulfobacteriota bacterium]|nr:hypothetical protein [Thermodesulfobacteriota bacterium]